MVYAALAEGRDAKGMEALDDALAEPDPVYERDRRLALVQSMGGEVVVA